MSLTAQDNTTDCKAIAKHWIKQLTPPILLRLARMCIPKPPSVTDWEYVPDGWQYAANHREVKGWNVPDILEVYKRKWPRFVALVEGTGPLGVAHESEMTLNDDLGSHNKIMTFAYALALAAHGKSTLSILDWGGGIGHYYILAKSLVPQVTIDYHCKDLPLLAEHGAKLFPDQHFYTDATCLSRDYDFVLSSSSIQYSENWQDVLGQLARATRGYLYVTLFPVVVRSPSFVFVQRPYGAGYNTEYLGWCINRDEFLRTAENQRLRLCREFVIGDQPPILNAPEQAVYRGYLFRAARA